MHGLNQAEQGSGYFIINFKLKAGTIPNLFGAIVCGGSGSELFEDSSGIVFCNPEHYFKV